jgi:hypothetical protein
MKSIQPTWMLVFSELALQPELLMILNQMISTAPLISADTLTQG